MTCHHGRDTVVKIGEGTYLFSGGQDLAVHPDFRRRGLWRRMNAIREQLRIEEEAYLAYWCTANPIVMEAKFEAPEFVFPKDIMKYVRIRDVDLHLEKVPTNQALIKGLGYKVLRVIMNVEGRLNAPDISKEDLEISEITSFDERVDDFWRKISDNIVTSCKGRENT